MQTVHRSKTISVALQICAVLCVTLLEAAEPAPRTTLSDPNIHFTVPEKSYVVLKRGALEAIIADNRAVDDANLPQHRAGYHGLASLKHAKQPRNIFVPNWAGLNFEHIHDGTTQERPILFEPRNAPMELRVIDEYTAELHQPPTPHWGLESCMRYTVLDGEMIEMVFECIPRRDPYKNGYIGLFWANYIDHPESRDIHFLLNHNGNQEWVRASTPGHGVRSTHLGIDDRREFPHDPAFPLSLVFNFSSFRYAQPWYLGICREMAFIPVFRPEDQVRFSQSPDGGGEANPAWDFQWFIPNYKVGQRYQLVMRLLYTTYEVNFFNPFESEDSLKALIRRARRF